MSAIMERRFTVKAGKAVILESVQTIQGRFLLLTFVPVVCLVWVRAIFSQTTPMTLEFPFGSIRHQLVINR